MIHFDGGDAPTHIAPVFPTLVFEVRAETHCATSLGGWAFAVFLGQGASFHCGKFGKLVEKGLTRIGGADGWVVHVKLSSLLDTIRSIKIAARRRYLIFLSGTLAKWVPDKKVN
jgi:hypothetical protein